MYAIVRAGGKQYRVSEGTILDVDRMDAQAGDAVTLDEVLLIDRDGQVEVGTPLVAGASVSAEVEDQRRTRKVPVFRYKNKTRQRRLRGHRQQMTRLRITAIRAQ